MAKIDRPILQAPAAIAELPVAPGKKAGDYLLAYKGIAYRAIASIAADVASIDLKLYRRIIKRGVPEFEEVHEHEALSLLHSVNDFSTFYDLMESTQVFLEANGEAFWLILRDAGRKPVEIWTLRPDWVTILPDKKNVIGGYKYQPGGLADSVTFEPADIIHFKYVNPTRMSRGKGPVQAAAMEIDLDDFTASYTRNFFFNSAVPSLLIKFKDKLDPEMLDRFVARWEQNFRGVRQSHKIAAIAGDVETEPLNTDLEKMGLVEQRKYNRDNILAIFQVPKPVVAITDEVNYANAQASIRAYMERTIKPKMMKFVAQLNEFYLRQWEGEDLFFDFADPVPADRELQLKVYENGLNNGWLTINEVREEENLEPVEGGDQVFLPFNLIPIATVGDRLKGLFNKTREVIGLPVIKSGKKKTKFTMPVTPRRLSEIREDAFKKEMKPKVAKLLSNVIKLSEEEQRKEAIWRQLIAKTDVWEQVLSEKLVKIFNRQEEVVLDNIQQRRSMKAQDEIGRYLFDLLKANTDMTTELLPFIEDIIKVQGKDAMDFLGFTSGIDVAQNRVVNYLKEFSGTLISGINDYTLERLRKTLAEGTRNGEGVDGLKSRVETVFESARGPRAEKIARTEVLRASNFGTQEAYKQSGVVKRKEWLTAIDSRVCPICAPLDGKIVDLNKNFSTSEGPVDYPPAHPQCRCTTIPVIS